MNIKRLIDIGSYRGEKTPHGTACARSADPHKCQGQGKDPNGFLELRRNGLKGGI